MDTEKKYHIRSRTNRIKTQGSVNKNFQGSVLSLADSTYFSVGEAQMSPKLQKISNMLKYIQKMSAYDLWSDQQICSENEMLFEHVKLMNEHINDLLIQKRHSKQHIRQYFSKEESNSRSKPSLQKSTKVQYYQAARQIECNQKLVQMLRKDLAFVTRKLDAYQDPAIVIQLETNIRREVQKIKIMKHQISQFKRRNVLISQQLKGKSKNDFKPYLELKQEYLMYLRKRSNYESKIEKQQQAKTNTVYEGIEVQQNFISVKNILQEVKVPDQTQNKHNLALYSSQRKKLQLIIRKLERDQESHKHKYYATLKQLERVIQTTGVLISRSQKLNQSINITQIQIFQLKQKLKRFEIKEGLRKVSTHEKDLQINNRQPPLIFSRISQQNMGGFMLTELEQKKETKKIQRKHQDLDNKYQDKFFKASKSNTWKNNQKHKAFKQVNQRNNNIQRLSVSKQKNNGFVNSRDEASLKNSQRSDQYKDDFQNDCEEKKQHNF